MSRHALASFLSQVFADRMSSTNPVEFELSSEGRGVAIEADETYASARTKLRSDECMHEWIEMARKLLCLLFPSYLLSVSTLIY